MDIKEFVKDSLSNITNEELINKYSLSNKKDIFKILSSEKGQEEINKQQKPLTDKEKNDFNGLSNFLNEVFE